MDLLENVQERRRKMINRVEHIVCQQRLRELGLFGLEKKQLSGHLINIYKHLKGAFQELDPSSSL